MSKENTMHFDKFCRFVEWYYSEAPREYCGIYHPSDEDLERDGETVVSADNKEGFRFNIFDSLEQAIENSTYPVENWHKIDFSNLSNVEQQTALNYIKAKQNESRPN